MTKIEALELELAARKMVEGMGLDWKEVIRLLDWDDQKPLTLNVQPLFDAPKENYELALSIIEGKPVWKGDALYDANGTKLTAGVTIRESSLGSVTLSWNPPNPKTVMVELLVVDAVYWSDFPNNSHPQSARFYEACRKALEGLK